MMLSKTLIQALTNLTHFPEYLFTVAAPCAFLLFSPKKYVDLFLQSSNLPDVLNPWVGLALLFSGSAFISPLFAGLYTIVTWPLRWLWKKLYAGPSVIWPE